MGFYASFEKFKDLSSGSFDGTIESLGDTDPFEDAADVDPTGLETDLDSLEEANIIDEDDEADETFEDLDDSDIEVGEALDEESINEVDLDFERDDIEPDWDPEDAADVSEDPTDISDEDDDADTQKDDEPYDEWSETSTNEEISQWDDILEDDDISQLEETGYDEPLFYPEEADLDQDPTDEAWEDIEYVDHRDTITDNAIDEIEEPGRGMLEASTWVDAMEDFLDFTEQDVTSFHEVSEGFSMEDGYDPPNFADETVDMLEMGNIVDDVFVDIFADPVNEPFWWFDSFE